MPRLLAGPLERRSPAAHTGSMGTRAGVRLVLAAALGALATGATAQPEDLTLPPRLGEEPGETRLAPPRPARPDVIEEVVVIAESEWRVPDLGDTWRANAEAAAEPKRIAVSVLPIYDPERPAPDFDPMRLNRELRRVGFIEVFRVHFGRRDDE